MKLPSHNHGINTMVMKLPTCVFQHSLKINFIKLTGTVLFLSFTIGLHAQRALPVEVNRLFTGIPLPQNCAISFQQCTKETDPTNHTVQIKDAGETMNNLDSAVEKDMKTLGEALMPGNSNTATASMPTAPSQEQIAQMQAQAKQMQGMTPAQAEQMAQHMSYTGGGSYQPSDPALMEKIGKAQNAAEQLQLLMNALSTKATQLGGEDQQKMETVKRTGNCPSYKVQGADIAMPRCSCLKGLYLTYYRQRVSAKDDYMRKLNSLLKDYLPKIKEQIRVIDQAELKFKYGDAFHMQILKTQAVGLQQQAFGAILPILGMVEQALKESGSEYTGVVNTQNGYLPEPCQ